MKKRAALLLSILFASCMQYMPPSADSASSEAAPAALGTGWGDRKESGVRTTRFTRASKSPVGTDTIRYNSRAALASMSGLSRIPSMQSAAGGTVEWGVPLPSYKDYSNHTRYIAGVQGKNYSIRIKNRDTSTIEVVTSVDGLNVMDGKPASFAKRGYLIEPGKTLVVDGFRDSANSVARFEFAAPGDSYANRSSGSTRNIGIIGIAVFRQASDRRWAQPPPQRSKGPANPFPGN